MIGCIVLVLYFRSSENLTAAYGIAVTGAFAITTVVLLEGVGTQLASSYSGLGGKLSAPAPAAEAVSSKCKGSAFQSAAVCE